MNRINKIGVFLLLAFLAQFAITPCAYSAEKKNKKLDAQVETRRISKGTKLKIKLMENLNTKTSPEGEMFNSMLITDETVNNAMILPSGTLVRGYVQRIKAAKMASIGAILYVKFDHIVTPSGTQLPIKASLTYNNDMKLTLDGGLRKQAGYGDALKENWSNTKNIVSKSTHFGLDIDNVAGKCIVTPFSALAGTLGGSLYLVGDSVVDIFRFGKQVSLNKGDVLEIIILNDLDVPVN